MGKRERRNKCSNTNRKKLGQKFCFKKYPISDRAVFLNALFSSLYSSFHTAPIKRLSRGGSRQIIHYSHFIGEHYFNWGLLGFVHLVKAK